VHGLRWSQWQLAWRKQSPTRRAQEMGGVAALVVGAELSWDRAAEDIERISRRLPGGNQ